MALLRVKYECLYCTGSFSLRVTSSHTVTHLHTASFTHVYLFITSAYIFANSV